MDLNHRHDGAIRLLYRETLFPGPGTSRSSELPASYAAFAANSHEGQNPFHRRLKIGTMISRVPRSPILRPRPCIDIAVIHRAFEFLVELDGIEPTTSSMPWKRSPS